MKKYALVPLLILATAIIGFAAVGEARRLEARRTLEAVKAANDGVARVEKRVMRFSRDSKESREMTFEIRRDGRGHASVKMTGMPSWEGRGGGSWESRGVSPHRPFDELPLPSRRPPWDGGREGGPGGRDGGPRGPRGAPGDLELDPLRAVDNYSVKTRAGEPVAGRATDVVELEPVAADRPSVRIWVDREKRFPVKLERRAVGGEWTVSFETSSVEFPAIEPIVAAAAVEPVKPVVTAEWLPSGFVHVRTTGTKGTESRYSDGVASLKIITGRQPWWQKHEKKAPEGALAVARHKMGPYAEYGLRLDEELYVTVLGSLSDEVMTRVVGALKRAP